MVFGKAVREFSMAWLALLPFSPAIAGPTAPPPFKPDRTAEDYSYLKDPAKRGNAQDGYKFIPLSSDGSSYLSFGGEIRERAEMFDAPRFGLAGGVEDTYLLQRILVHGDLHLGSNVRLFAQIGAHDAFNKKQLLLPDEDHLDVHQLFIDVVPTTDFRVRFGRQEMAFNPQQRFVSFRDGTNVRQNFDGGRVTYDHGQLRLEAFLVRPVILKKGVFDNIANDDQMFGGIYASHRLGGAKGTSTIDAYWMMLDRDDVPASPGLGRERRHSLGLRYAGASNNWDWDGEAVYQFGTSLGLDISAWAASMDAGYTLAASSVKPRLGLRFDAGSGDANSRDNHVGGFHPLFPKGPYFNEANVTSWTNLIAIRPSIKLQPAKRLSFEGAVQFKWRENVNDAVYLGPVTAIAATRTNQRREIGQVYTLDATFQIDRNFGLRGYYLHHTAGNAIAAAGGKAIDFLMASATFRF